MPTEAQDIGFVPDDVDVGFVPDGPTPEQAQAEMDRMKARDLAEGITYGQTRRPSPPVGPFPFVYPGMSPEVITGKSEILTKPIVPIPEPEKWPQSVRDALVPAWYRTLRRIPEVAKVTEPWVNASLRQAKGLVEFAESPLGLITAPAASGSLGLSALQRLVGYGFAADMASKVPEAARAAGQASVTGTPQEVADATVGLGVSVVGPALIAHSTRKLRPGEPVTEEVKPPPIPKTPIEKAKALLPESAKALSAEEQTSLRGELEAIDPEAYTQKGVQDATIRQRISEEIPLEVLPETSEKVGAQVREQAPEVKAQESQVSDRARYNEIQSEMSAMIEKGDMESPEFKALWQENETIKNRHGGMPPPENAILTPAVQAEGRTFTGKNHGEAIVAAARAGVDATTAEHVFLDPAGNVLNRADAAKTFTEKTGKTPAKPEGLHSEDLRDAGMLEGVTQGELKTEAPNLAGPGGTTPADVGQGTNLKQLEGALATLPGDPNAPGYWQQTIRDSFNVGKTMSQAKDTLGAGLNGLLAMGTRLKQKVTGFEKFTPWLKALGENQAARQQSSLEARQFANRVVRDMPALRDRKTREAITKWVDAGGDNAILAKAAAEVPQGKRAPYDRALKLTPDEVMAGRQIQQYFEARLQQAIDAGILENGIEDYIHRTYEKSSKWKDGVIAELQTGRLSTVKPALARKRIFEYDFEAEKAGYSPKNDFLERILDYDQSLNKAIADHNMVQNAMKITMPDGRPMFDVAGDAQQITTKGGKEEVIVRAQTKRRSEDPKKNRGDYVAFDHPALRKAKWVLTDENGQPIILKGDALVHPNAIKQVNAVLGKSRVRSWEPLGVPVGRGALAAGSAIKQTMLDLSGFHMVQIGVHGVEHMTNPFRLVELNLSDPSQAFLVKHGLNVADYHGYQMFTEGNAGSALHKLPGAGPLLQAQHEWLFKDFIPRVKMTMAEHALERNRARFQKELNSGKMTEDDLGYLTAQQSNAAFGGLNYEMLARSPTMRDLSRLALLAPDFLEARGRFAGQAFTKYGREQTRALVTGAIGLYVLARIANKIDNDDYHWEPQNIFSLVHNGRSYSLRTVQGDIMHLVTDFPRFWFNRLNPVYGRTGIEALTQRDAFGRKRDWKQQLQDFALTAMPISLRSNKEQHLFASILNAFGVTNKRWDAIAQTYKLAEPYRKLSPGEFIYDPDKDPFREVKLDLTGGYDGDAVEDLKKLIAKGTPLAQIDRHFFTYARSPFTGSAASEKRFVNGLTGPQKRIYEAALAEKRTLLERYNKARQAVK